MLENSFLSNGLSNFPEASRGNIESEKYICSGILKAANLSAKNNFRSSDVITLLSLNTIEALDSKGLLHESEHPTGMKIWSFLMKDFYNIVIPFFINNIYTYLEQPPKKRPYSL